MADAGLVRIVLPQDGFQLLGDVDDLALLCVFTIRRCMADVF